MRKIFSSLMLAACLGNLAVSTQSVFAQGTAFTYQGQLQDNGSPAHGNYDFTFALFNTNSTNAGQVGSTLADTNVGVTNGLFTTTLDFGAVFTGNPAWLAIGVRTNGGGSFIPLSPLQPLTPTPYAIYAPNAGAVTGSVAAAQLTGFVPASQISGALTLSQIPSGVVTNHQAGVSFSGTFNGTFSGNGAAISNLGLSKVAGGNSLMWGAFVPGATLKVGNGPAAVIAADLNGDGASDLVSVNSQDGTLSVFTNDGRGNFTSNATLFVGSFPIGVVAADINGDGKPDLITANMDTNYIAIDNFETLTIFTNDGSGRFVSNSVVHVGNYPLQILAADLNGDGKADLIMVDGDGAVILTNNGAGQFFSNNLLSVPVSAQMAAIADVNGDGRPDVLLADWLGIGIYVYTNSGHGFGLKTLVSDLQQPFVITAADVNGDGKPDLIAGNIGDNTAMVWTNDGAGNFALSATISSGYFPTAIVTADVNADGQPDLIVSESGEDFLTVWLNSGHGTFLTSETVPVGSEPTGLAVADVNGDQAPDLITVHADDTLSVMIDTPTLRGVFDGDGAGLANLNASVLTSGVLPVSVLPAVPLSLLPASVVTKTNSGVDLTGVFRGDASGLTNIAWNKINYSGAVTWGTFATTTYNAGYNAVQMTAGDYKGAGKPDIYVSMTDSNILVGLTNNGSGSFALDAGAPTFTNANALATANIQSPGGGANLVSAYQNAGATNLNGYVWDNSHNTWDQIFLYPLKGYVAALAFGDWDGDGKMDFVAADSNGTLEVVASRPPAAQTLTNINTGSSTLFAVAVADFNGDGKDDIVSVGNFPNVILYTNGGGRFAAAMNMNVNASCVAAADVNGDGSPDLIAGGAVLTNDGHGHFTLAQTLGSAVNAAGVATGDFNNDGKIDLAYIVPGGVVIYTNGGGSFALAASLAVAGHLMQILAADFNGDGIADMAVLSSAVSGAAAVTVFLNTHTFQGPFAGDGLGLTNLNAAALTGTLPATALPTNAVTNFEAGVTLSGAFAGSFAGNGAALTNVTASSFGAALLASNQTFSGANTFARNVGIGTTNPAYALTAVSASGDCQIAVQSGDSSNHLWTIQSSGNENNGIYLGQFQIIDRTLNLARLTIATNGNVGIGTSAPTNLLVVGSSSSAAYCNGTTWVTASDRNSKESFAAINPREVLEKVSALPITEWKYKVDADSMRHLGPVAQDFHSAFGLNGADDKHIATVDEEGVALAAIQGLNQKVEERDARIQEQGAEIATLKAKSDKVDALEKQLSELKQMVQTLAEKK